MAILAGPSPQALASGSSTGRQAFTTRVIALTLGLIWQFVLSMIIVYREEGRSALDEASSGACG